MISPYLKSVCCNAPIAEAKMTLSAFAQDRMYIACIKCRQLIDYYDNEFKWRLDRIADQEFIVTESIYDLKPDSHQHPFGTLEERRAYWGDMQMTYGKHWRATGAFESVQHLVFLNPN